MTLNFDVLAYTIRDMPNLVEPWLDDRDLAVHLVFEGLHIELSKKQTQLTIKEQKT